MAGRAVAWEHVAAVAFDCDGVLVDSGASAKRCWRAWAARYGVDGDAVLALGLGCPSRETVAAWLPAELVDEAVEAIDRLEIADAGTVRAIPGAGALLAELPAGRWGIVTSASRELAAARLTAAGLPVPAVLVSADDVVQGKPHPEGYRTAVRRLGVGEDAVAVLEDSGFGIAAARSARVGTIIRVGTGPRGAGEDAVVPDLRPVYWAGHLGVRRR